MESYRKYALLLVNNMDNKHFYLIFNLFTSTDLKPNTQTWSLVQSEINGQNFVLITFVFLTIFTTGTLMQSHRFCERSPLCER